MKRIIIIVIALSVIIFGVILYLGMKKDIPRLVQNDSQLQSVNAVAVYADGTYTLTGSIVVPTPCHALDHTVEIDNTYPKKVTVAFTTKQMSEVCAQVLTPAPFSVSFDAPENALIDATLNGKKITLSIDTKSPRVIAPLPKRGDIREAPVASTSRGETSN